jgi:hypothetical protein
MRADYIERNNLITDRLIEAIKLNCHIIGNALENMQVKISITEGKNTKPFKSSIRSDLWHWAKEAIRILSKEHRKILHMVNAKSCWVEFWSY